MNQINTNGFMATARKNKYYIHESYMFVQKMERNDTKYYKCISNCGVTLTLKFITDNWTLSHVSGTHSHTPDKEGIMNRMFISEIKKAITESPESSARDAYNKVFDKWSPRMTGEMFHIIKTFDEVRSGLQKFRRLALQENNYQNEIIGVYAISNNGDYFLIEDEIVQDIGRVVIFGSPHLIPSLVISKLLMMDGTFKTCPKGFRQVYTLHFEMMGHMFPCFYALLPDQTASTYRYLLRRVKEYAQNLTKLSVWPTLVQTDFEQAMITAIRTEWMVTSARGCYFHFTQAIWRKVQEVGLSKVYCDEFEIEGPVRKFVQRMSALPLLPELDIDEAWAAINGELDAAETVTAVHRAACTLLKAYMERTWLGPQALFKRDLWNHADNDGRRTNNDVEGWHNALKKAVGILHPHIFRFIRAIKKLNSAAEGKLQSVTAGKQVRRSLKKYERNASEIEKVKLHYRNGNVGVLQFLDLVGQKIKHR